jgi:hypothetical protein
MLGEMRTARSGHVVAVHAEVQNQSTKTVADQHIVVRNDDGRLGLLPCYASRRIDAPTPGIKRVLVVVHGALRDSDRYFAHAEAAARGLSSSTLIVAPQFLADVDLKAGTPKGALYWDVEGWKGGEPALGPAEISSFTAMDCLLHELTGPGWLSDNEQPAVVIVGNSAGGQYVNRYAAVGRAPDALAERGIPVRFIISNPSTYLYFDRERPVAVVDGKGINHWRYGFEARPPYVDGTPQQNLERYLARDVTIVLGAEDRDSDALLLEVGAAAMAQGANRHDRGIKYNEYIHRLARDAGLAARHKLIELAGIGHAADDILAAPQTRQIMFGLR